MKVIGQYVKLNRNYYIPQVSMEVEERDVEFASAAIQFPEKKIRNE